MKWTQPEIDELIENRNAGVTWNKLAKMFHTTENAVEMAFRTHKHSATLPAEEDPKRTDYWKRAASKLAKRVADLEKSRTAVDVLVEQVLDCAPKSYTTTVPIPKRKPGQETPQPAVLLFSDTHIGKIVKPDQTLGMGDYNFQVFLSRLQRLEEAIASIVLGHTTSDVPEIVVGMLGDMLDGALDHSVECGQSNTLLSQYFAGGHAIAQFLTRLSQVAPLRIHTTVGNHCVDGETEILTARGWLRQEQILDNDICLGLEPDGKTAVWQPINEIVREKQVDRMVSISNRQFNFRGTEHHRFYYWIPGHPMLNQARWSEIKHSMPITIPTSGRLETDGAGVPDQLIELVAAVLTDGCLSGNRVVVYQSPSKLDWVKEAFTKSGLAFSTRVRVRKPPAEICGRPWKGGETTTEVSFALTAEARRTFYQLTGISQKETLPAWAWRMTHSQFERFMRGVISGDGSSKPEGTSFTLCGKTNPKWLDELQALCALHGWNASLSSYQPNNSNPNTQYRLNLMPGCPGVSLGANAEIEYSAPTGELVWCVRTPTENFFCRRNGKSYFTGNTRWQNQHKMPTENRNSNLDQFLYVLVQALTRENKRIHWKLDWQPFTTFTVAEHEFFAGHGDNLRGGDKALGIPNHAVGRTVGTMNQLFSRAGMETPNYFCFGHLHRPITLPHTKGEVIVNGAFPGVDGYSLTNAFNSSYPSQKFFLMHPRYGRTACYDIRLDFPPSGGNPYTIPEPFSCQ